MPFVYSFISARSLSFSLFHAHVRAHATYTPVPDFLAIIGRFYPFFLPSRSSSIGVITRDKQTSQFLSNKTNEKIIKNKKHYPC